MQLQVAKSVYRSLGFCRVICVSLRGEGRWGLLLYIWGVGYGYGIGGINFTYGLSYEIKYSTKQHLFGITKGECNE